MATKTTNKGLGLAYNQGVAAARQAGEAGYRTVTLTPGMVDVTLIEGQLWFGERIGREQMAPAAALFAAFCEGFEHEFMDAYDGETQAAA